MCFSRDSPRPGGRALGQLIRGFGEFGTMTVDLLALADWLTHLDVTHVALEPIAGYWRPAFFRAAAFLARQAETIGESINREAHRTLVQFLEVPRRQRGQALKVIKNQPVDLSQTLEAVETAANGKKWATIIALVQKAIVEVANGTRPADAARETEAAAGVAAGPTRKPPMKGTTQDRCRRAYRRGLSWRQLMTAAHVSESTTKRYINTFSQELAS